MKTYEIEYDDCPLATVEIDESKAADPTKEMVEFWGWWEQDLENHGGDYTHAWLNRLARYILRNSNPPGKDQEGWYPLDGSYGITLLKWEAWEHDENLISIG